MNDRRSCPTFPGATGRLKSLALGKGRVNRPGGRRPLLELPSYFFLWYDRSCVLEIPGGSGEGYAQKKQP
jgi:hypothetical protein